MLQRYGYGVELDQNELDRAHFIGESFIDKNKNKKVRSNIIKFRSWESIAAFYKARPRNHLDRQRKSGSNFNVSLDLTELRYNLLTKKRGLASNNHLIAFAFSDINCSLVLKFSDNTFHYFHTEYELDNLLNSKSENN